MQMSKVSEMEMRMIYGMIMLSDMSMLSDDGDTCNCTRMLQKTLERQTCATKVRQFPVIVIFLLFHHFCFETTYKMFSERK